ncbi:MAG: hypothetical protein EOM20_01540 [Spartobacteria bacterium]|nr:hypothetical protein [Spartobacteria bacterium]
MKFKNCIWLMMVAGMITSSLEAASPELKKARSYGAQGKVTLRVVDDLGNAVTNAFIDAALKFSDTRDGFTSHEGYTDTNGTFEVEGKVKSDMVYTVTKSGYYKTIGRYWFYSWEKGDVQNGRWLPWNPVVEVVLKPKKNPIPMYAKRVHVEIPGQNQPIGFDMEKGDWVSPHGKGLVADVYINYSLKQQDLWTGDERFEMSNTNLLCGVQELNADMFSAFRSVYDAPLTGYVESLKYVLNRTKTTIIEEKKLSDSNYIVFRSRAAVDEDGRLERANYGKVYPPIKHGRQRGTDSMVLIYYFNPTPNDRNLEFDLDRNLFKYLSSREQVVEP